MTEKKGRDYWAEGGDWQQKRSGHGGPGVMQFIKPIRKLKSRQRKASKLMSGEAVSDLICPACGATSSYVKDSRGYQDHLAIRRRRECQKCGSRFSTLETIVELRKGRP